MEVNVKDMSRVALIEVNGRVDSSTAPQLGEALQERISAGKHNVVVSLENVDYMSSAGLRELVSALKRVKVTGGDVRLAAPNERVQEVFELAGLDAIFTIYDDVVAAVGSF